MNRIFNVTPRSVAINIRPGCYFFLIMKQPLENRI